MKLKLNREFLTRHLFALGVFLVLGGWFGYDAFVRYPAVSGHDLYVAIEGSEPAAEADLEAFKRQKIATQRIFSLLTLLAAAGVGVHLLRVVRFTFAYDEEGFVCNGVRRGYPEIQSVDLSRWEKKGILVLVGQTWKITLDSWHFEGVKDFQKKISNHG